MYLNRYHGWIWIIWWQIFRPLYFVADSNKPFYLKCIEPLRVSQGSCTLSTKIIPWPNYVNLWLKHLNMRALVKLAKFAAWQVCISRMHFGSHLLVELTKKYTLKSCIVAMFWLFLTHQHLLIQEQAYATLTSLSI